MADQKGVFIDVFVVGCLLRHMRSKFRHLHVENPICKKVDGIQFQIDGHLEGCWSSAAAQGINELKEIYKNVFKPKSLHNY